MAVTSPWDLVSALAVPATVKWWPLLAQPVPPVTLGSLAGLVLDGLVVGAEYDPPQLGQPDQVIFRGFTVDVLIPLDSPTLPAGPIAAFAVVDTEGTPALLAIVRLDEAQDLRSQGAFLQLKGYLQAMKYQ